MVTDTYSLRGLMEGGGQWKPLGHQDNNSRLLGWEDLCSGASARYRSSALAAILVFGLLWAKFGQYKK